MILKINILWKADKFYRLIRKLIILLKNVKNIENGGYQCEDIKQYLRNKPLLAMNVFVYRK